MLAREEIPIPPEIQTRIAELESQGNTIVPVAIDRVVEGLFVIADSLRAESKDAIAKLRNLGIQETVLISGDNTAVAQAVGSQLGVDRVHAETLPENKLSFIRDLQAQGKTVAYVGDGVNDAPALAAADVGIAMGTIGTNVAMETADIVLLTDKIERIPDLIALSRATLRTVRANVVFSMSVNVLSVVLSTLGIIGPAFGAILHELSALPVIVNSASLIKRKPRT
jgi:Cd2+/Zn2+-exporting ATPase